MAELDTVMEALSAVIGRKHADTHLGRLILQALVERDEDQTALKQAVIDVAEHLGDADALASLRWQVKKAMIADPVLAGQIRNLLPEHERTMVPSKPPAPAVPGPPATWATPQTPRSTRPVTTTSYRRRTSSSGCPSCGGGGRIASRDAAIRECSCGTVWDTDFD